MTLSYAKCLRKGVRAVPEADEGALGADRIFCFMHSQRGDQEHGVYTDDTQAEVQEYISACSSLVHLKWNQFRARHITMWHVNGCQ